MLSSTYFAFANVPIYFSQVEDQPIEVEDVKEVGQEADFSEKERFLKNHLIKELVLTCLAELAVASALVGGVCCFVAKASMAKWVIGNILIVALSALVLSIQAWVTYDFNCSVIRGHQPDDTSYFMLKYLVYIESFGFHHLLFSTIVSGTYGTFCHEMGHALAGLLLCRLKQWPKIEFVPFAGAFTQLHIEDLTRLGKWLGEEHCQSIITVAGPGLSILNAMLLLFIAHQVKDSHPKLHTYLISTAISEVFTQVLYAFSSLQSPSVNLPVEGYSDFYVLWKGTGIHPLVAIVTMIALPIFLQLALWKIEAYRDSDPL